MPQMMPLSWILINPFMFFCLYLILSGTYFSFFTKKLNILVFSNQNLKKIMKFSW